jgi:transcriptional regulator with XRE-family HTH domain
MPFIIAFHVNRSYYAYMNEITFKTPKELQIALGERVRRLRLARNTDQRATAGKAGISEKALRSLEAGRGSTVETLLRTLKALDALQGIEMLAPEVTVDPLALLHSSQPPRRVRRPRKPREGAE